MGLYYSFPYIFKWFFNRITCWIKFILGGGNGRTHLNLSRQSSTQWFDKSITDAHFMHLVQLLRVMPKRVKTLKEYKEKNAIKN